MKSFRYVLVFFVVLLQSCAPMSKESYLAKYKFFMDEVSIKYENFTDEDWKQHDKSFEKFAIKWKAKFKDEYTWKEELLLIKYDMQYHFYKEYKHPQKLLILLLDQDYQKFEEAMHALGQDFYSEMMLLMKESGFEGKKFLKELDTFLDQSIQQLDSLPKPAAYE